MKIDKSAFLREIQTQLEREPEFRTFLKKDAIAPTAVIELESAGRRTLYLIAPQGGGIKVSVDGKSIQIITPQSPVGDELLGRRVGDSIEVEAQGALREFEITAIA